MKPTYFVKTASILLVIISFAYLAERLWSNQVWAMEWRPSKITLVAAIAGVLVYTISSMLLSGAWTRLLVWCGEKQVKFSLGNAVYGRSQIAKYIPGNVFHYAGRQVLGRQAGFKQLPMAGASVLETVGIVLGAGIVGVMGILAFGIDNGNLKPGYFVLMLALAAVLLVVVSVGVPRLARVGGMEVGFHGLKDALKKIVPTYSMYVLFMIIVGGVLALFVHFNFGLNSLHQWGTVIAGFAVAWIAGFVTPGAPGGLGVREAVITLFLAPIIGDNPAVVSALLFRVITVLGDVLFFFSAVWLGSLPSVEQTK